jgi:hypothetical protein
MIEIYMYFGENMHFLKFSQDSHTTLQSHQCFHAVVAKFFRNTYHRFGFQSQYCNIQEETSSNSGRAELCHSNAGVVIHQVADEKNGQALPQCINNVRPEGPWKITLEYKSGKIRAILHFSVLLLRRLKAVGQNEIISAGL